jgi:hypothetical protein
MRVSRGAVLAVLGASVAVGLGLLVSGCGGGVEVSELPFTEDFADCGGFSNNDDVSTVDCEDGELRVLVSQPDKSPVQWVPIRFDARPRALSVSAVAHAPSPGDAWGIGCMESDPYGQPRGYALFVTYSGRAGILRLEGKPTRLEILPLKLTPQGVSFIAKAPDEHTLSIRCVEKPAGTVRVQGAFDGGEPLTAVDKEGLAPFSAAFVLVSPDGPETDVRFDDVSVEEPT